MLHTKGQIFKVSELFQVVVAVTHGDILRSVALVFGVSRLLAMVKDIGGFRPIVVSKVFLRIIIHSIVLQLWGPFQEHLSPISLEYQPLEAMRPSILVFKPSLICTLIGL
jgi:hypothetical protein